MARGSKASYSNKQKRMASHIESSYKRKGSPKKRAGRIAWATVNKETGGAHGRGRAKTASSSTVSTRARA